MNEPKRSQSEDRIRSLREQILTLSDGQNESLRLATFGGMSAEEGKEFDRQQGRLIELIKQIAEMGQQYLTETTIKVAFVAKDGRFRSQPIASIWTDAEGL